MKTNNIKRIRNILKTMECYYKNKKDAILWLDKVNINIYGEKKSPRIYIKEGKITIIEEFLKRVL